MGTPTNFPEANFTWKGWPADADRPEVVDLPTYRADGQSVSCWRLGWRERLRVLVTGRVWLHVLGGHPPVLVSGDHPFDGPVLDPDRDPARSGRDLTAG